MTTLEIIFAIIALLFTFFGGAWGIITMLNKRNEDILKNDLIFEQQQLKNTDDIKKISDDLEATKKEFKTEIDAMKSFKEQQGIINAEFKKDILSIMQMLTNVQQDVKEIKTLVINNRNGL